MSLMLNTGVMKYRANSSDTWHPLALSVDPEVIRYYTSQNVSTAATSSQIMRIPASGTDDNITVNSVVLNCTFANSNAITSDVSWTSNAGYISFTGTCSAATTADVTLGRRSN